MVLVIYVALTLPTLPGSPTWSCPNNSDTDVSKIKPLYNKVSLTHWGRVTYICVSKLTIIVSDNGLSPGRRQAIICTNAGMLLIGPLGTNFNETSIEIHTFSLKIIHLKISSGKWRPFCLGLNVLRISVMNDISIVCLQTDVFASFGRLFVSVDNWMLAHFNVLRPRQKGRNFVHAIFEFIFVNIICCILMQISLKCALYVNNKVGLIQILPLVRTGNKPLSEPMMA